jgi:Protein of unknown function (DUF642)
MIMKLSATVLTRGAVALLLASALALPLAGAPVAGAHRAADASTEVDGPNILANGGFEQGADPGAQLELPVGTSPMLAGWTVINRYVNYVGTYWKAEEGTRSISLAFDGNNVLTQASGLRQSFPTTAGLRYRVVFYQGAYATTPTTVRCKVAGLTHDYTYQAGPTDVKLVPNPPSTTYKIPWVKRTLVFTATAASTTIEFDAFYLHGYPLGLDNVQVRAIQTAAATGTPQPGGNTATVTLQLAAPTLAAGSQQTVQGTAGNNASVALVVDYPDGTQLLAPLKAGTDGHYTYKWTVPTSVHGTVQVLGDSAGKSAHGSFVVS